MAGPESLSTPPDPSAVGTVLPFRDDLAWQRPTVEDMIIAYSTLPGFTSNRDHELGTWFIQSLVRINLCNHQHLAKSLSKKQFFKKNSNSFYVLLHFIIIVKYLDRNSLFNIWDIF